jgi:lysophospholipid acyltransferase (LPLAT)-like uncharacterized protein
MKLRNRTIIRACAWVLAWTFRAWFRLTRRKILFERPGFDPYGPTATERYLVCIWHDGILGIIFACRHQNMAGLVSWHADGSYIADVMSIFGIRPIRGSSGRGGAAAVRSMMEAAREYHIAIASDGPRGPRREVKDGILYLASQTGREIIPMAFAARNAWRPRGRWTDMVFPKLGSRSWVLAGNPYSIPPGLKPSELEPHRVHLQAEMNRVQRIADEIARGEREDFDRPAVTEDVASTAACAA